MFCVDFKPAGVAVSSTAGSYSAVGNNYNTPQSNFQSGGGGAGGGYNQQKQHNQQSSFPKASYGNFVPA